MAIIWYRFRKNLAYKKALVEVQVNENLNACMQIILKNEICNISCQWKCRQAQLKVQAALCKTCFILFAVCQAYTSICQAYSDSDMDLMLSDSTLMIK